MLLQKNNISQIESLRQDIAVRFTYDVHFTKGLFNTSNPLLSQVIATENNKAKSIMVVVDSGLLEHHPQLIKQITNYTNYFSEKIKLAAEPIIIPGGEAAKNDPSLVDKIQQTIEQAGICRHSYVLAIGGGAVIDMVGYAAATAHRGVRLIRIPTTVLAQNDSGVGVKNSINAFGKKNFLGTFAPPVAVLNDFDFLSTLEDRDWRSGIAEAIKVALIKDPEFFQHISDRAKNLALRDTEAMEQVIYRCAELHLNHIANYGDPFEMGSSRPLDFGHWAAHKLEYLTNYRLRHGEAVAIGIALDCTYSYLTGLLNQEEWQQIIKTLQNLGFELFVPELASNLDNSEAEDSIFCGLVEFREHLGGNLAVMLLPKIGQGLEVNQVNIPIYKQAILMLQEIEVTTVS
ncbi:3-dehydroquinate synthase [Pleurocapsa sp. PCC 7319]|uniref:3-dehydroquinate synthase n=1 Tax=Pleurocapsa sp. PCC 7319 TaxID=118161 RepID=UPI00034A76D1|nr:3-dehydroquinate synthase [Pleurocapsa sp. PCC 7319]